MKRLLKFLLLIGKDIGKWIGIIGGLTLLGWIIMSVLSLEVENLSFFLVFPLYIVFGIGGIGILILITGITLETHSYLIRKWRNTE